MGPWSGTHTMSFFRSTLLLSTFSVATAMFAGAQAVRTASKSADISVFGGFEAAHPDYGPYNSYGGMFGVDFTRHLRFPVEPSLEFRANLHSNVAVSEHSYVVGLKAAVPFRFIKPYGDFLVGPGNIHFPYNIGYTQDSSVVYSFGGGIDVPLFGGFAAKFDLQGQHWNTGELTYTPTLGTIGLSYTIPFRAHRTQRDLGR